MLWQQVAPAKRAFFLSSTPAACLRDSTAHDGLLSDHYQLSSLSILDLPALLVYEKWRDWAGLCVKNEMSATQVNWEDAMIHRTALTKFHQDRQDAQSWLYLQYIRSVYTYVYIHVYKYIYIFALVTSHIIINALILKLKMIISIMAFYSPGWLSMIKAEKTSDFRTWSVRWERSVAALARSKSCDMHSWPIDENRSRWVFVNQKWVVRQFKECWESCIFHGFWLKEFNTRSLHWSVLVCELSSTSCNNPNSCSGKTSSPNSQCHTRKRDGQNSNWFTPFVHRWIFHWSPLFKWCKLKKGRLQFLTLDQWVNQTPSSVDVVLAFTRVFKSCQNVAWVAFMLLSCRSPSWPSVCSSPNKCLRLLPSFHRTSGIIEGCAVMECWKFVYKYINNILVDMDEHGPILWVIRTGI